MNNRQAQKNLSRYAINNSKSISYTIVKQMYSFQPVHPLCYDAATVGEAICSKIRYFESKSVITNDGMISDWWSAAAPKEASQKNCMEAFYASRRALI